MLRLAAGAGGVALQATVFNKELMEGSAGPGYRCLSLEVWLKL